MEGLALLRAGNLGGGSRWGGAPEKGDRGSSGQLPLSVQDTSHMSLIEGLAQFYLLK